MNTIFIAGYYGFRNAGDEAILAGMLHDLRSLKSSLSFIVMSGDPVDTETTHHVRAVHWQDFNSVIEAVRRSALVIVGGGGIFQDHWGFDPTTFLTTKQGGISHYGGIVALSELLRKPCVLYGVGVGPLNGTEAQEYTRYLFELAEMVTVRDNGSYSLLNKIDLDTSNVVVTADPAFSMPIQESMISSIGQEYEGLPSPLLGVCLRQWEFHRSEPDLKEEKAREEFEGQVAGALDDYLESTDGSVLFIPFQDGEIWLEDDLEIARRVRNQMSHVERAAVAYSRHTPLEKNVLIYKCDLVLGMRLHALIAGIRAGVPCVAIQYDPKIAQLMDTIDKTQFGLDLHAINRKKIADKLVQAYEEREVIRNQFQSYSKEFEAKSKENAQKTIELMTQWKAPNKEIDLIRDLALNKTSILASAEIKIERISHRLIELENENKLLANRMASRGWKFIRIMRILKLVFQSPREFLSILINFLQRYLPTGQLEIHQRLYGLFGKLRPLLPRSLYDWLVCTRSTRYVPQSRSVVKVFTDNPDLFPDYHLREALSGRSLRVERVSLVVTVKDEASSLPNWLNQLQNLTRRPDEVVVVDGGSKDDTAEILKNFAQEHPGWFHVYLERGINIARGRNIGIEKAQNEIIAVTDVGCDLDERWLENIIAPFEANENIEVVAGWYEATAQTRTGNLTKGALIPNLEQVDPQSFLPSSRSLAFRKVAWESVGGYPEWLTLTAEDTFFALELKRAYSHWAFVPEAVTIWHAPSDVKGFVYKVSSWVFGDGEAGLYFGWRTRNVVDVTVSAVTLVLIITLLCIGALGGWLTDWRFLIPFVIVIVIATSWYALLTKRDLTNVPFLYRVLGRVSRAAGFLRGIRNRPEVWSRRYGEIPGVYIILAVVPIDDTGGGSRSTQLALELLNRGYLVYYIHKFPSYESLDLGELISHPNLIVKSTSNFAWESFAWECGELLKEKALNVILELPHKHFVPIIKKVKKHGGRVIYDLIDDWDSSLGATWYSTRAEQSIIELSDILVATAPQLQTRLTNLSGREVKLAPNAVNLQIFNRRITYPLPREIGPADFTVIYVGALWGEWFDWDLLRQIAQRYSTANIIVIGDYRGQCTSPPSNIQFLGLKPQIELPPYLAHVDVAIIPWHISPITHATSPLKVYEFLAMSLPVVAPKFDSLEGIPYVLTSIDRDEFIHNVGQAVHLEMDEELLDQFLVQNSWKARVDQLIKLLEEDSRSEVKL